MKKKILIKVQMNCDKCRPKAMKLIAAAQGVDSVAIDGEEKDHFLVTGDNIDCVKLTTTLRKKVGHADIVTLNEVKKEEAKAEEPKKEEAKAEEHKTQWVPCYYPHPHVVYYHRGCKEYPDLCSIL